MKHEDGEWSSAVAPIVAKLTVGAKFGTETVFNRDGSDALAKLLNEMARLLDGEVERRASVWDRFKAHMNERW